jgi:hypothetical protein
MLKAYAHGFSEIEVLLLIHALAGVKARGAEDKWQRISDKEHGQVDELLTKAERYCKELDLQSSVAQIEWIRSATSWSHTFMARALDELRRRIEGELKYRQFLYVPLHRQGYYDQAELFGPLVAKHFHSATDDIVEAGNCFALGRWTATVHQCLGVMQAGLIGLARHLKCSVNIHVDTWEDIIIKVENGIKAKRAAIGNKARWKELEPFYNEVVSDLRAVKNAWRNTDAHFRRSFDEAGSLKVLEKVRDFMQNLATRVRER